MPENFILSLLLQSNVLCLSTLLGHCEQTLFVFIIDVLGMHGQNLTCCPNLPYSVLLPRSSAHQGVPPVYQICS